MSLSGCFKKFGVCSRVCPLLETINTTTTITAATLVNRSSACNSLCFYPTFPFWSKKEKEKKRCMKIIDKTHFPSSIKAVFFFYCYPTVFRFFFMSDFLLWSSCEQQLWCANSKTVDNSLVCDKDSKQAHTSLNIELSRLGQRTDQKSVCVCMCMYALLCVSLNLQAPFWCVTPVFITFFLTVGQVTHSLSFSLSLLLSLFSCALSLSFSPSFSLSLSRLAWPQYKSQQLSVSGNALRSVGK